MSKTNHIKWLYNELPELVTKGILPESTARQLKNHYGEIDEKPAYNIAIILAAILGAILIGGGIILLFAHNWDQFSRPVRTLLSFTPLVIAQLIYGYVFFKRNKETALVESSAAFLMLMLAACIALISQTYHIYGGGFNDFLLLWMLLSIPLLYLMNATLPAIFYLVGISSWALNSASEQSHWYWLLLLAAVPHLVKNMYLDKNLLRSRLLGWTFALTFAFAWFRLLDYGYDSYNLIASGIFIAAFYLLGERIYPEREQLVYKPFQFVTVCFAFVLLMMLGYDWPDSINHNQPMENRTKQIFFLVATILAALTYLYLAFQDWKAGRRLNYFVILLPVFLVVGILLSNGTSKTAAIVLANAYLFGFGLYYIKYGIETHRLSLVNLGMFFISALIVARFFDTDWSFVIKGLVFILLGIGFLYVNVVLARRLKNESLRGD